MRVNSRWSAILLIPALCACSMTASIESTAEPVSVEHAGFAGMTVLSSQHDFSAESQYGAQVSAGAMTDKIADRTPSGYLVMTSSQGALLSNSVTTSMQIQSSLPAQ